MFKNYLVSAFRNLLRNKFFSIINIGSLAIGFAACLLISLFVRYEMSYDTWLKDADRIAKMEQIIPDHDRDPLYLAVAPVGIIPGLDDYFDEIEESVFIWPYETVLRSKNETFFEVAYFIDPDFFKVIDLPMAYGNRDEVTTKNTSLLINERLAKKYFGEESAVGKRLSMEIFNETLGVSERVDYEVAGVFKNIPANSHMDFEIIALSDIQRFPSVYKSVKGGGAFGYVKFKPGADIANVEARFSDYYKSVAPKRESDPQGFDYREVVKFNFINVQDVHLFSDKIQQIKPVGDIQIVASFVIIAVLILIIAAINFTNLTTAKALNRSKEVSLRKVMGAKRGQLIRQFLGEAILTSLVALIIALFLMEMFLPYFNGFLNMNLAFSFNSNSLYLFGMVLLAIFVGVMGGLYPAFFSSRFRPAKVLGANKTTGRKSGGIRQFLVILQFSISIGLIVSTVVIYYQTDFARTTDLGFEKENKVVLAGIDSPEVSAKGETLREELLKVPGVTGAALTSDSFPLIFYNDVGITIPSHNMEVALDTDQIFVDSWFFQVLKVEPIAGRLFSKEFPSDNMSFPKDKNKPFAGGAIVNETFLRMAGFGLPEEAVGKVLVAEDYFRSGRALHTTIVGVVPDLVLRPFRTKTEQMVFFSLDAALPYMILDVSHDNREASLAAIEDTWKRIVPNIPIRMSFLEDDYAKLYDSEERSGQIFTLFSVFAIFVACLGLLGLASFAAEQRTKEISIRKVLGASVSQIVKLLNWQFLKPVILANLIAWPVAYFVMKDWLEGFVYRIDLTIFPFLLAGGLAIFVASLIVSSQSLHAARRNPIHALQSE